MQMIGGVLLDPTRYWECPACSAQFVTHILQPHAPFHPCKSSKMKGALVPYVEKGVKASLRINRREDYQGTDIVTVDGEGVPVMSVTTQREDGEDCMIFAPCIRLGIFGNNR